MIKSIYTGEYGTNVNITIVWSARGGIFFIHSPGGFFGRLCYFIGACKCVHEHECARLLGVSAIKIHMLQNNLNSCGWCKYELAKSQQANSNSIIVRSGSTSSKCVFGQSQNSARHFSNAHQPDLKRFRDVRQPHLRPKMPWVDRKCV